MIDREYSTELEPLSADTSRLEERAALVVGALGVFILAGTAVWGLATSMTSERTLNEFLLIAGAALGIGLAELSVRMYNRAIDPNSYSHQAETTELDGPDQ